MKVETIGNATLYLGDCREILPLVAPVDSIVTDPPYGIAHLWKGGMKGWEASKAKSEVRNEWDEQPLIDSDVRLLLDSSTQQIIWGGNYFPLPPSRCWLIWQKEHNPALKLADAELAWTNFDAVVRSFHMPRSKVTGNKVPEHPTAKPVPLMEWCVAKTSGVVCDPYMGGGSTGVACANLQRPFVGIEINPAYFQIACDRIEAAHAQGRLFA